MLKGVKRRLARWLMKRAFRNPAIYDVACALRGPDPPVANRGDSALKELFTARIRRLAGLEPSDAAGWVREEGVKLSVVAEAFCEVTADHMHFLNHVGVALSRLRELGLMSREEYEFLTSLQRLFFTVATRGDEALAQTMDRYVNTLANILEEFSGFILDG